MPNHMYLHEEFMLLALKDEAGTVATSESIEYPLAAALLAELLLSKRLELEPKGNKKMMVNLVDSRTLHDDVLDEALEKIKGHKKQDSLPNWVERLASLKRLKHRTALQLCRKGILSADEEKVLLFFNMKVYPEIDPAPERQIVDRLRRTIFSDSEEVDPRDAVLVSLSNQTHLLDKKFDKDDLKKRKDRIKKIADGSLTGKAAQEVVDTMNAILFFTVIIPVIFD